MKGEDGWGSKLFIKVESNKMKKIGILFGQENTFPQAFVDRVNSKKENGITAELAHINKIIQGEPWL